MWLCAAMVAAIAVAAAIDRRPSERTPVGSTGKAR
jgi:hypothetical protein